MEITIRKVKPEDLDAVVNVEAECFPEAEAATRSSLNNRINTFPDSFYVAEDNGRIIGFVNGCITNSRTIYDELFIDASLHDPNGSYQAIFGLDVVPEYRNKGMAAKLMNHLIDVSMKNGRKGLILTCKEHLLHYYSKFGFVNLGVSGSTHGGAVWYDMILEMQK